MKVRSFLFLVIFPMLILGIFFLSAKFPEISEPFGGAEGISQFLVVLLTYVYVVLTGLMVHQMVENQRLERRPYMVVDFEFVEHEVWLVLRNIGRTPAKDVEVEIRPDIQTITGKTLGETIFKAPFPFFPPNREFRTFLESSVKLLAEDQPNEYEVRLRYHDVEGREYLEQYILGIENQRYRLFVAEKGLQEVLQVLKSIRDEIKRCREKS